MSEGFVQKIKNSFIKIFKAFPVTSVKSLLSFKGLVFTGIIVLIIIFRDIIIDYTIQLTLLAFIIILLLLLYFIIRLFSFVIPFIIHYVYKDMIRNGALLKTNITERMDKSSLLEERYAYGKDEFYTMEKYINNTLENDEQKSKVTELSKRKSEILSEINNNILNLKANYHNLNEIEKEFKNYSIKNNLALTKSVVRNSFNIIISIGIIVLIPFLFYMIYHFLKVIGIIK